MMFRAQPFGFLLCWKFKVTGGGDITQAVAVLQSKVFCVFTLILSCSSAQMS